MYDIYTSNESSCNFAISYEEKMYIFDRTNGLILKGILKARAPSLAAGRRGALRARSLAGSGQRAALLLSHAREQKNNRIVFLCSR